MKLFASLFLFILFSSTVCLCAEIRYNLKDIEALVSTENYQEFFDHIYDLRPSERDESWEKIVLAMAEKYISALKVRKVEKSDYKLLKSIFSITHLKNDEFFREKRDQILIKYVSENFDSLKASDIITKSKELSRKYAENISFHVNLISTIYPYISANDTHLKYLDDLNQITSEITSNPFSEFYCDKSPLNLVLKTEIYYKNELTKTYDKSCLKKLMSFIRDDLDNQNMVIRNKAFKFLTKFGELSKEEKANFHIINMVYGMKYKKSEWDDVFNSLEYLGTNDKMRRSLLEKLQKHDPFPDVVFKIHDNKKTEGLSRLISRYFPEFLDKYTQFCLSYLSGEVKYPFGNPTPNCHRYMEISKKSKSSPEAVLYQYDEIMNSWKK